MWLKFELWIIATALTRLPLVEGRFWLKPVMSFSMRKQTTVEKSGFFYWIYIQKIIAHRPWSAVTVTLALTLTRIKFSSRATFWWVFGNTKLHLGIWWLDGAGGQKFGVENYGSKQTDNTNITDNTTLLLNFQFNLSQNFGNFFSKIKCCPPKIHIFKQKNKCFPLLGGIRFGRIVERTLRNEYSEQFCHWFSQQIKRRCIWGIILPKVFWNKWGAVLECDDDEANDDGNDDDTADEEEDVGEAVAPKPQILTVIHRHRSSIILPLCFLISKIRIRRL